MLAVLVATAPSRTLSRSLGAACVPARRATTFASLGLSEPAVAALHELGVDRPTTIQALAIPHLLSSKSAFLAAPTGSGKTLAFLVPVLQRLVAEEKEGTARPHPPGSPRCLVLSPSRELGHQTLGIAKSLAHHLRCRVVALTGGRAVQREALQKGVDVLVCSPSRLRECAQAGEVRLGAVGCVVLDEADTLLSVGKGKQFGDEVRLLVERVVEARRRRSGKDVQLCLASATLTPAMRAYLKTKLPWVHELVTSDVHRKMRNVKYVFERMHGPGDKHKALLDVLVPLTQDPHARTLVFCNTIASCRSTHHFLTEQGVSAACYHGEMPAPARASAWAGFVESAPRARRDEAVQAPGERVLVCTDIAGRGLDTMGVTNVVMFDFPLNVGDFIHRAGRVGRMGRPGTVTALVTKRDAVLAAHIESASLRNDLSELSRAAVLKDKPAKAPPAKATPPVAAAAGGGGGGVGGVAGARPARERGGAKVLVGKSGVIYGKDKAPGLLVGRRKRRLAPPRGAPRRDRPRGPAGRRAPNKSQPLTDGLML